MTPSLILIPMALGILLLAKLVNSNTVTELVRELLYWILVLACVLGPELGYAAAYADNRFPCVFVKGLLERKDLWDVIRYTPFFLNALVFGVLPSMFGLAIADAMFSPKRPSLESPPNETESPS